MKKYFISLLVGFSALALPAHAFTNTAMNMAIDAVGEMVKSQGSATSAPLEGKIEIGFSPNGGALELIVKTINAAQSSVDLMAYSFTSAEVTRALRDALKRGVKVRMVVDHNHNFKGDSSLPMAALNTLRLAGADVRTISAYAISHDKVCIIDGRHVQTGSFNYSKSAAVRNSENVIVLWNNAEVAKIYSSHFQRNWKQGQTFYGR